ncbi:DUF1684 domain-containing protein [Arsenicicoccus dermatophilus]|uniref:DUF1684 domain-containing protein n=1 Tax=Arsenicicoccus dermatophilus TaxID=1076331 RepID=UPI001F4D18F2|nr:DUF1684 domain-containing protein [Arsenicicoccus dermatophilus]MCH8612174.1 DUF1684 domain-containing protein [Arsenicicoccus dermatophilus]
MTTENSTPAAEHQRWREARHAAVTGPHGNLALVGFLQVTEEPERLEQIPATVWRVGDADGIMVTADAADEVRLDGELVDGDRAWARLRPDGTPILTWQGLAADAFSLDGSAFEVRVYDPSAPRRAEFERIDCYDYDPELVVPARFVRDAEVHAVPWEFSRGSDSGALKQVPGSVRFTLGGEEHELAGFLDGRVLVIVFADATTGPESYAPGRFLKLDIPQDGELELDFNQAFVPPCGFSDFYSCPLPPAGNRLSVPVRGGERRVIWREQQQA